MNHDERVRAHHAGQRGGHAGRRAAIQSPQFSDYRACASSTMPWKSTITGGSSPTTHASCPEGSNVVSPGLASYSVPSSILIFSTPPSGSRPPSRPSGNLSSGLASLILLTAEEFLLRARVRILRNSVGRGRFSCVSRRGVLAPDPAARHAWRATRPPPTLRPSPGSLHCRRPPDH